MRCSSFMSLFLLFIVFSSLFLFAFSAVDRTPESLKDAFKHKINAEWEEYKMAFGKSYYSEAHEQQHRQAFLKHQKGVQEQNVAFESGDASFKFGFSSISDMTDEEFQGLLGFNPGRHTNEGKFAARAAGNEATANGRHGQRGMGMFGGNGETEAKRLPRHVDWRNGNGSIQLVTPVKNQGHCGSCWAFSTVGVLEAAHARATGKLVSLSEQNLVDCDSTNNGCQGGFPMMAFTFAIDQGGLNAEEAYAYRGVDAKCHFSNMKQVGASSVGQVVPLPVADEWALMLAVARHGPISVAIQVTYNFRHYAGGILDDRTCSSKMVDGNHAVLVVGYGTDSKWGDYWIVKNSWGKDWGEQGYIRMARNKENQCGIATQAVYVQIY